MWIGCFCCFYVTVVVREIAMVLLMMIRRI